MIEIQVNFPSVSLDTTIVNYQAELLADQLTALLVNQTKSAVVSFGAIATGETLRRIRGQFVLSSQAQGIYRRQVIGDKGLLHIVKGRKKNSKLPVRLLAGAGKRGGKVFTPLPEMLKWFIALNIPRAAWFPIMRAISRRGIKPRNVPQVALDNSKGRIRDLSRFAGSQIGRGIVKYGK